MKYPYQVFLGVTYKCNLNCKHCYVHKKIAQDIPLVKIKKLIDTLANKGVIKLVFTHGESLIRNDFEDIVEYASQEGFYLTLLSNGTLLTEEKAKKLALVGLNKVQISLDSLDSCYHNQLRRRPLAWEKALEGIEICLKTGLKTGINTTVNKHNYLHLEDFVKFAINKKLEEIDLLMVRPSSEGSPDEYNFNYQEYKEIVQNIWSYKQKYQNKIIVGFHDPLAIHLLSPLISNKTILKQMTDENICQAGKLWVSILPNGEIQPCNFLPMSFGNAYLDDFDLVLKRIQSFLDKEFSLPSRCESCEFSELCTGGCKGFAVINKLDPRCNYLLTK